MKTLFLSFKSEYYKALLYGLKKYEYRKRFCNEEVRAYLYLSGKERKVVGYLDLGKPIRLDLTKDDYINYPDVLKRVDEYIATRDINAVPIKSLTLFKDPLSLEDIRMKIPNFMPPQMYFIIDNKKELKSLLENREIDKTVVSHSHESIYYDNLAVSVKEIFASEEFKRIDKEYK